MNTAIKINKESKGENFPKLAYKKDQLFNNLINKKNSMAVVGLGYVGLPLAVHMASKFKVIGFDLNEGKVLQLLQHKDPCNELSEDEFLGKDINFTANDEILKNAKFYIVAVPTPIDDQKKPNLTPIKSATATIAKYLKKGDCVVFESTVYPGCTEEICVPILERISRLKFNEDFTVGYSPERINPGDKKHTFTKIKKVVAASTKESLETVSKVYEEVVIAGVHKAPTIKVAEAAKVVENTQRDVNIGLMNELSKIFSHLNINTKDVLEAAGTKWNFHNYFPGLVGGHCIGVDPYYLISKAKEMKYTPKLLEQVREVNESMIQHIGVQLERRLFSKRFRKQQVSILVKGIAFKEDVNDIRNSKTAELCLHLISRGFNVDVHDYLVEADEVKSRYGIDIVKTPKKEYDAIILAVDHENYKHLAYYDYLKNGTSETIIFDVKGDKKDRFPEEIYMSL
ncbi:UDP-N-acetyl-D-galactosamine dehydrogenase [Lutibacter sp. Hel_I_33_5]|uniref:nucleotide sugar dehydrogenase n=1 Tax=Lutibacter sp. Hel_I_33_5 TaxID=1566289 RepID=UPI0011A7A0FB|nr:nucleotide sugar dehydrogenase [Lutibacter sp. Hel_I_33_5]TVZ56422.1 UDP-N-acetyl-D-galactosamine dehydrogenase [Lutibacter sp. Hel_I_33_5]